MACFQLGLPNHYTFPPLSRNPLCILDDVGWWVSLRRFDQQRLTEDYAKAEVGRIVVRTYSQVVSLLWFSTLTEENGSISRSRRKPHAWVSLARYDRNFCTPSVEVIGLSGVGKPC